MRGPKRSELPAQVSRQCVADLVEVIERVGGYMNQRDQTTLSVARELLKSWGMR